MDAAIGLLADHPQMIAPLAAAYARQWPDWYGPGGPGDALQDMTARAESGGLPVGLVAIEDGRPIGACALAERSIESHAHLRNWIVGLWVAPNRRGQGLGGSLVQAARTAAAQMGLERLHAATADAARLFERAGWTLMETIEHDGERLSLFTTDLRL